MSEVVLDATALLAMLKGERGALAVAGEIPGARISAVNYADVASHFIPAGMPGGEVDAMLDPLPMMVVPVGIGLDRRTAASSHRDGPVRGLAPRGV